MYKKTLTRLLAASLAFTALTAWGCSASPGTDQTQLPPEPGPQPDDPTLSVVTYKELDAAMPNPERGFYYPYDFHFQNGEKPAALNVGDMTVNRTLNRTLVLLEYFLRDFIDKPLSEECLDLVKTNMRVLREGGCKCVLRFAYCDSDAESAKPWDAEEQVVMGHIAQLKPILQQYADVIYVLQAGFVGVWGEWYYTDNFIFQPQSVEDYRPRRRVLDALLDAMPADRMVAVRTPLAAMKCLDLTGADSILRTTAHDASARSRIACHNDCFLASGNDVGTFNSKTERELWMADTHYVSMGGETCGVSSFCSCSNSLSDMEKYHWSYLNISYHQGVIKGWKDDACFDEIERRLGYRFVLTEGRFSREVKAGEPFRATIRLRNDGFASPINPRGVELVFVADDNASERYTVALDDDPRFWFGGESHSIAISFDTPALKAGHSYTLCLNLPDGAPELSRNPLFSIRTANEGTWDEKLGYNKLYTFTAK